MSGARALAALAAVALLAACQKDAAPDAHAAAGRAWQLESLDGAAFEARATLIFPAPGKVAGEAPCNRFSATQDAPFPRFEIGPVAATRMACPDMAQEQAFLSALPEMRRVEVLGDTLILSNEAGRRMVFRAE